MEDNVWCKAIIIASDTLLATPRRLNLCHNLSQSEFGQSDVLCIALCKQECLETKRSLDDPCHTPNYTNCAYPNVILAECHVTTGSDRLKLESSSGMRKAPHYILEACHEFLANYLFYNYEMVWFRKTTAYPLERVVICTAEECSTEKIRDSIDNLFSECDRSIVIFQKNFKFHFQPHPSSQTNNDHASNHTSSSTDDIFALPSPLTFDVLGTTPALQGRLTSNTKLTIVSPQDHPFSRHSTLEARGTSFDDDDFIDDDILDGEYFLKRRDTLRAHKQRSVSLSSASDIRLEDSVQYEDPSVSLPPSSQNIHLVLDAQTAPDFKLQYHFILIPKKHALEYNLYDLHHVLITTFSAGPASGRNNSNDFVLQLNNDLKRQRAELVRRNSWIGCVERKHLAVVRHYDSRFELEAYMSQYRLGVEADLNTIYIHPELFFYLFPESLSVSPRRYLVQIENLMATPTSATLTHPLSMTPSFAWTERTGSCIHVGLVRPHDTELMEQLQEILYKHINKLVVNIGDVFSVITDYGQFVLRVTKVEPEGLENGGLINDDLKYSGLSHSFLSHLVSPSYLAPPTSYWEELHPPGLEKYCQMLFNCFATKLVPGVSVSTRCTLALISGPPGVGKRTVINSVARQCRMSVLEFDCYDVVSDVVGTAERKLRKYFDEAIKSAPCVMILKEIQVLTLCGPNESSYEDEPRLVSAFERFITSVTENTKSSPFPVIVVGVTGNSKLVSSQIQQYFLHELVMSPPTLEERRNIITGLSHYIPLDIEIDHYDIAQSTAGFVLGDFVTLFTNSRQLALTDLISCSASTLFDGKSSKGWVELQDLAIAGVLITHKHLSQALNDLHTLHSSYIGTAKIPEVKWEDIGGLETAKKEILETIQLPLLHPELFSGGLRRSGILLYGAPGTGKTLLAKAVATECKLNFISIKGPELINMYVGQTEENIREVFYRARGAAPCVIFFDELDSIAPNRGKSGDSGGVMDRVVSQLLAELDGMDKVNDVFVIGATNRPDLIDPALLRPGRFDRLVYLDVCNDVQSKLVILKAITRKFNLHNDVDLEEIARACPTNLTGADLYSLCTDAMLATLRKHINELEMQGKGDNDWEGVLQVCQSEFLLALKNLTPSVTEEELDNYRNKKSFTNIF